MGCCDQKNPATPTLAQAAGLFQAGVKIAVAVATGNAVLVSPEVKAARLALCVACPACVLSDDKTAHKCTECQCWLDGTRLCKACLATEKCPLAKWEAA